VPFGTLFWADEHSDGRLPITCHRGCLESILHLVGARLVYWQTSELSEALQAFWREAEAVVPDWPRFHRMKLSGPSERPPSSARPMLTSAFGGVEVREDEFGFEVWRATITRERLESEDE
jgi:hypothetical protein